MRSTLNTITTAIASHLKLELDEPFKRLLASKVDNWRSTLIGRSLDKTTAQRRLFTQKLIVDMQPAEIEELCLPKFSLSIKEIPTPMRIGTILFDYVGAIDGDTPFGTAVIGTHKYLTAGKYSRNSVLVEYVNRRLQIKQLRTAPKVMVNAVWDKPIEVFEFNNEGDFWNEPYPATEDMIQMITQYILTVDYNRPVTPVEPNEVPVAIDKKLEPTNG